MSDRDRQRDPYVPHYPSNTWWDVAIADDRPLPEELRGADINDFIGDEDQSRDPVTTDQAIFNSTVTWFEGEVRAADQQILGWIGRVPTGGAA